MDRYQIEFDVHFGYWYNVLCEKFYARCDLVLNLIQLIGGSAVAAGVVSSNSSLISVSGVLLAIAAAFSLAWQPGIKSERHRLAKDCWLDLKAEMHKHGDGDLVAACARLQKQETGMTSLNLPAVNAAIRALGRSDGFAELSGWQRFVQRIAM